MFITYGQDTLYYRNQSKEIVYVQSYRPDRVTYRKLDTADHAIYYASSRLVAKIVFLDGREFLLKSTSNTVEPVKYSTKKTLGHLNAVYFDAYYLVYQNIQLGYRRTFKKAKNLTLSFPLSTSFGSFRPNTFKPYVNSIQNNIFSGGIELLTIPNELIVGVGAQYGLFNFNQSVLFETPPQSAEPDEIYTGSKLAIYLKLGAVVNLSDRLYVGFMANLGDVGLRYEYQVASLSDPSVVYTKTVKNDHFFGELNIRFGFKF